METLPAPLGPGFALPFAGLLLSIALGQALWPSAWARHFPRITALWSVATLLSLGWRAGWGVAAQAAAAVLLHDYLPFIVTILALYAVAGGIHIRTRMSGHPSENVVLLALATLAAAVMGTPGATLLFLPVLITANGWRRHRTHTMVFVIFLAANLGGAFTPLGPPLLMGLLQGVAFLWTVEHMMLPAAGAVVLLLALYALLDALLFYPREDKAARARHRAVHDSLAVEGLANIGLLALAILVLGAGDDWAPAGALPLGIAELPLAELLRMAALLAIAGVSLHRTPRRLRAANHFTWAPFHEVAILFAGIFVTMLPVLAMLREGGDGPLGRILLGLVSTVDGRPLDWAYFLVTGSMSSVLDNAPTFLVFFNLAGGDAATLMGSKAGTLTAISAGAAFWGAVTYIGNAPNFMVRSIAESRGIAMPDFFRLLGWSAGLLLPVFALVAVVFFGGPAWLLAALPLPAALFLTLYSGSKGTVRPGLGD